MIRKGYRPKRKVLSVIGPVFLLVPKVRDRSGSGVKLNSNVVPLGIRKSPRASTAAPWLYPSGVWTGDTSEDDMQQSASCR